MLTNPSPRQPVALWARRSTPTGPLGGHLVVDGIHYRQNGAELLTDLSFEARPGSTTHIVASSANDASALLGLLVGLYPPESGTVGLDGIDLTELPLATARSTASLVLRDPWIMNGTIADNITFGDPGIPAERVETIGRLACVDEIVDRLPDGYETVVGDAGRELPIGQRRCIALARALLRNPQVLLVEDPLRDLDARAETNALKALNRAGVGRTVVITTQRFDASIFSSDQILTLADGRLHRTSADGTPITDPDERFARVEPAASPEPGIEVGEEIAAGYRAAGLLRQEALTETWLAWHDDSADLVEVKVGRGRPDAAEATAALADEFDRATRLRHPGIATPLAADLDHERPHAVYERVEGHLLSHLVGSRIDTDEPLDPVAIGADLARTLSSVHRLGHVLLGVDLQRTKRGRGGVVVTTLDRARPIGAEQNRLHDPAERRTIAPEQLAGAPAAPAMDLYALGVLLYQVAQGSIAFTGSKPDVRQLDPELPAELVTLIGELLDDDPDSRPDAVEVLDRLRRQFLPVSPDRKRRGFQRFRSGAATAAGRT